MKAHEILSQPCNWTQRNYAKDKQGKPVSITDNTAFCFCVMGALHVAYPEPYEFNRKVRLLNKHIEQFGFGTIPQWNDSRDRTHEEIVSTLRLLDI